MCSKERIKLTVLIIGVFKLAISLVIIITTSLSFSNYFKGITYIYENNTGCAIKSNVNFNFSNFSDQCTNFTKDEFQYLMESIGLSNSLHSRFNGVLIKLLFFIGVFYLFFNIFVTIIINLGHLTKNEVLCISNSSFQLFSLFSLENIFVSSFFSVSMIDYSKNYIDLNIKLVPIQFFNLSIYYLLAFYSLCFILITILIFLMLRHDNSEDDPFYIYIYLYILLLILIIILFQLISLVLFIVSLFGSTNSRINAILIILNTIFTFILFKFY
jgi:hypothetical protein